MRGGHGPQAGQDEGQVTAALFCPRAWTMPPREAAWMEPNGLASLIPKGYMGRGALRGEKGVQKRASLLPMPFLLSIPPVSTPGF